MSRIEKIKAYRIKQAQIRQAELEKETQLYLKTSSKVIALKDRIKELIETANVCIDNNIEINMYGKTGKPINNTYSNGTFMANKVSYKVGFIEKKPEIEQMGVYSEDELFSTDGENVFTKKGDNKMDTANISLMEKFLNGFDSFETAFYKYIDEIVGE